MELGIDQEQFEGLLDHLGLNGEINFDSLLQSLTQEPESKRNHSRKGYRFSSSK